MIANGNPTPNNSMLLILVFALLAVGAIIATILACTLDGGDEKKPREVDHTNWDGNQAANDTDDTDEDTEESHWTEAYQKANKFISKCNQTEKINLLFGTENMKEITPIVKDKIKERQWLCVGQIDPFKNDDIDFKGMCLQDGPAGIRFANGTATSWQAAINTAATFNKDLMYTIGKNQGQECRTKGINVLLGPGMNMMRNPQGGRGWEGFGEDPYLAGVAGAQVTKGIQEAGVIACIKHFVGNDQETYRKASSSNMDYQALMDVYAEPFYRSIKYGHAGSVMVSYNAINNSYVYENKTMMTDILRNILHFKGFVVSDWWEVVSNTTATINGGMDMNMPGGYDEGPYDEEHLYDNYGREHSYWTNLSQYVKEGKVKDSRIDEAATRIIAAMYQMGQMDGYPSVNMYKETKTDDRKKIQRQAATESQVLLKNDGILPIDSSNIKKIAIIGSDASPRDCINEGDFNCVNDTNLVYNGNMPLGYGSGTTTFGYLVDPYQAVSALAKNKNIEVVDSRKLIYGYTTKEKDGDKVTTSAEEDIDTAKTVAKDVDLAIVFVSADSGEEYTQLEGTIGDRPNLTLWHKGEDLVDAVAKVAKKTIVVINSASVVDLPFLDNVNAILYSGFPGAETGNAIADILFGEKNPSGHLPFVWGKLEDYGFEKMKLEDMTIQSDGKTFKDKYRYNGVCSEGLKDKCKDGAAIHQHDYTEGIYIGQRWFNKQNKKPTFPFGHGLSYTTFKYSNLKTTMSKDGLTAEFEIENTGKRDGLATPMMFLTFPDYIGEYPAYILKGFEKVNIDKGDTEKVKIKADAHALSYFNLDANNYVRVNKDKIKVYIGENGDPSQYKLFDEVKASY